jgi:hypothetical protein
MRTSTARLIVCASLLVSTPALAIDRAPYETSARGFPALRDAAGKTIADGDFVQWIENDRLHVRIRYVGRGLRIEENAVFRQRPDLAQDAWSLREVRNGKLYRAFTVDFTAHTATAQKLEDGELKHWSDDIKVDAGCAFAGFGFSMALKALRKRLMNGEHIQLQAVGFTPKPRVINVDLSYTSLDRVRMAGRSIQGEHYVVHPKLPLIADLFVDVPDAHLWLTNPGPATFLRWEGPLAEPKDPIARVDLLPGGESGPAVPVAQ